ncbi:hypothetical protein BpHYR1_011559 [Brachionus plicatilis]|uniref:Uncharacterized protein n=1 Tax=Brachionus plicatilis TaxID=10195 RepID=A0A3M7SRS6_BRAPC|nr:hypothetical protein BpHYR1_011559 [Brachionus plicatilis]
MLCKNYAIVQKIEHHLKPLFKLEIKIDSFKTKKYRERILITYLGLFYINPNNNFEAIINLDS